MNLFYYSIFSSQRLRMESKELTIFLKMWSE